MVELSAKVDTSEFDKAFKEYMKYTSRSFAEAANQHALYIARDAVKVTKASTAPQIKSELMAGSDVDSNVPLAAIYINSQLGKKGEKGLTGKNMADAVDKFVKKRQRSRNWLRAGWIPAIKKLAALVPKKGGYSVTDRPLKNGGSLGGAIPAKTPSNLSKPIVAEIWNDVFGNEKEYNATDVVTEIIFDGAQQAIAMETENMRRYIERKKDQAAERFNRFIGGLIG